MGIGILLSMLGMGLSTGLGIWGANKSADAVGKAGQAQSAQSEKAMREMRARFQQFQKSMQPYMQAGGAGLQGYMDLLGLGGDQQILQYQGQDATTSEIEQYENLERSNSKWQAGLDQALKDDSGDGGFRDQTYENRAEHVKNVQELERTRGKDLDDLRNSGFIGEDGEWSEETFQHRVKQVWMNSDKRGEAERLHGLKGLWDDYRNSQKIVEDPDYDPEKREGLRAERDARIREQYIKEYGKEPEKGDTSDYGYRTSTAEERQKAAIDRIAESPEMRAMTQQAETGLMANASVTGGIRGGNTQSAIAGLRPQILGQLINQKLGQYSGLAGMGMGAAGQVGSAGMNVGGQIAGQYNQIGNAQAQVPLATAAGANQAMQPLQTFGNVISGYGLKNVFSPNEKRPLDFNKTPNPPRPKIGYVHS